MANKSVDLFRRRSSAGSKEVFIDLKRNQEGLYLKIKERRGRGSDGQVAQDMVMLPASDPQELEDLRDALDSALATAEDHVMKGWGSGRRYQKGNPAGVQLPASAGTSSWSTAYADAAANRVRAWGSISGGSGTIAGSVSGSVTGSATGSTGGGYKTKGRGKKGQKRRASSQWSLASSASDSGSKDPRDSSTTVFMSGLDPSTAWQEVKDCCRRSGLKSVSRVNVLQRPNKSSPGGTCNAIIEFLSPADAAYAVEELEHMEVDGCVVQLRWFQGRRDALLQQSHQSLGYGERGAEPVQNVTFTTTIPADMAEKALRECQRSAEVEYRAGGNTVDTKDRNDGGAGKQKRRKHIIRTAAQDARVEEEESTKMDEDDLETRMSPNDEVASALVLVKQALGISLSRNEHQHSQHNQREYQAQKQAPQWPARRMTIIGHSGDPNDHESLQYEVRWGNKSSAKGRRSLGEDFWFDRSELIAGEHRKTVFAYESETFGANLDPNAVENRHTANIASMQTSDSSAAVLSSMTSSSSSSSSVPEAPEDKQTMVEEMAEEARDLENGQDDSVFVSNLDAATTSETLKKHAEGVGKVVNAELLVAGSRSLGCGVVQFSTKEEAMRAITELNKTELDGKEISVRADARVELK